MNFSKNPHSNCSERFFGLNEILFYIFDSEWLVFWYSFVGTTNGRVCNRLGERFDLLTNFALQMCNTIFERRELGSKADGDSVGVSHLTCGRSLTREDHCFHTAIISLIIEPLRKDINYHTHILPKVSCKRNNAIKRWAFIILLYYSLINSIRMSKSILFSLSPGISLSFVDLVKNMTFYLGRFDNGYVLWQSSSFLGIHYTEFVT